MLAMFVSLKQGLASRTMPSAAGLSSMSFEGRFQASFQ
jgi:hypothetical protein